METILAMVTIEMVPTLEIFALLTEHISGKQVTHISLLASLSREEVMAKYGVEPGEESCVTLLSDGEVAEVSRPKIERDVQALIDDLDDKGADVTLLMSTLRFSNLVARKGILLEPDRIVPPLISSIVDGHQVGVLVAVPEMLPAQQQKWSVLKKTPFYSLANPHADSEEQLLKMGRELVNRGADVLLLDCLSFHQRHRDQLHKELNIPVILTNALLIRLAAELLV